MRLTCANRSHREARDPPDHSEAESMEPFVLSVAAAESKDKRVPRRSRTWALIALALAATPASAKKYPERPIRLIIQSPAGGTADLVGRIIAQKMGDALG